MKDKDKRPDGTFSYYDENGTLQHKWMPPDQLKELLDKSGAKGLSKVLIKDPLRDDYEDFWDPSDEIVERFGDADGTIRVVCHYEKGEPKYNFIAKRLWDRWDEVAQIVNDPGLSSEQKTEAINALIGN